MLRIRSPILIIPLADMPDWSKTQVVNHSINTFDATVEVPQWFDLAMLPTATMARLRS